MILNIEKITFGSQTQLGPKTISGIRPPFIFKFQGKYKYRKGYSTYSIEILYLVSYSYVLGRTLSALAEEAGDRKVFRTKSYALLLV